MIDFCKCSVFVEKCVNSSPFECKKFPSNSIKVRREMWYTGRDSNPQPSEPESDALSIEPPVRLLYSGSIISGFWDFVKRNSKKFSAFFRQRGAFSRLTAKETVVFPPILWYNQQKHFAGEGTLRWNS